MTRLTPGLVLGVALTAGLGSALAAQQPTLPLIRPLGAITATSAEPLGDVQAARLLRDGRVLAYDAGTHRVLVFDSALAHAQTVIDSATPRPSTRIAGLPVATLLPLRGDSTALFEAATGSMFIIDPTAKVARTTALSLGNGAFNMNAATSKPFIDQRGRLVYREPPPFYVSMVADGFVGDTIIAGPDSFPLLRFDLATRRTDTVAVVRAPRVRQAVKKMEHGGRGSPARDPVQFGGDDWVQLDDGTIAIVRIGDYHVDWLRPNGTLTSGPRVAHEWTTISDSTKVGMVASLRTALDAARADSLFPLDSARFDSLALVVAANPDAFLAPNGKPAGLGPPPQRLMFVSPSDLPDHWPPFNSGGTVADADGTLWIPAFPVTTPGGGQVFDVIGPNGVLTDRVELPRSASLLGVSRGVALLRMRTAAGVALATARVR